MALEVLPWWKDLEAGPWTASALQTIEKYFTVTENVIAVN
jgi:hypothetical protein